VTSRIAAGWVTSGTEGALESHSRRAVPWPMAAKAGSETRLSKLIRAKTSKPMRPEKASGGETHSREHLQCIWPTRQKLP